MKTLNLAIQILLFSVLFIACKKTESTTVPEAPVIQNFVPLKDTVGGLLTINGSNFSSTASNNMVKVKGIQATVISASVTKLVVQIPAGVSGDCSVSVTVLNATANASVALRVVSPIELLIAGKWVYAKSIRVDSSYINSGLGIQYLPWPFMTPLNNTFYNLDANMNYMFFVDNNIAISFQEAWGLGQSGIKYRDTIPYSISNNQIYLSFPAGTNTIAINPTFNYPAYTDTITVKAVSGTKMEITRNYHHKHYGHANTLEHRKYSIDSLVR